MTAAQVLRDHLSYRLVRPLAEGGMGCVYEAEQTGAGGFSKRVAIKIIREQYSAIPEFRRNFIGEARLVSDLIHSNIVQIYHLGEVKGHYFMVMEFVNGVNLEEFILQHRALRKQVPIDLACFVVSRICRGLNYAHHKRDPLGQPLGLVHRDVNPRNILLSYEGDVKLTDFGIAKALNLMYNREGEVIAGKDEYLSPEQARREVTDARADIFSCGIILSELLCGENVFEATSCEETRQNIEHLPLPDFSRLRRGVDRKLNTILHHALRRDRDQRYQTAAAFLSDLEMHLYGNGYGPTHEKMADYLTALFAHGKAYVDDLTRLPRTMQLLTLPPSVSPSRTSA